MKIKIIYMLLLIITSYNASAKIALPDSICQPDDKENICELVLDDNVVNVMINGTLIRPATIGGKNVSIAEYRDILIKKNCNEKEGLFVAGDYDKNTFTIVDMYCAAQN